MPKHETLRHFGFSALVYEPDGKGGFGDVHDSGAQPIIVLFDDHQFCGRGVLVLEKVFFVIVLVDFVHVTPHFVIYTLLPIVSLYCTGRSEK